MTQMGPQFMVHFPRMNHHGAPSLIVTQKTGGFTGPFAILPNFRAKHFSSVKNQGWNFKLPASPRLGFPILEAFVAKLWPGSSHIPPALDHFFFYYFPPSTLLEAKTPLFVAFRLFSL